MLVKDRNAYDLHNKRDNDYVNDAVGRIRKQVMKEDYWNCVRPGSNRNVRQSDSGVFAQIRHKHKHKDVTGER